MNPLSAPGLKDAMFTLHDAYFVVAFVVAITIVIGFVLTNSRAKRKEDQEDAAARTKLIMEAIETGTRDSARDVRELSDKVKDGRTVLEKDIEAIRSVTRHDINNVKTSVVAGAHIAEKQADEIVKLRDRMTAQETNGKHQNEAINKLESTFQRKFDEMKDLIKSQGETSTAQFRELSTSLREARETKLKS